MRGHRTSTYYYNGATLEVDDLAGSDSELISPMFARGFLRLGPLGISTDRGDGAMELI